MAQSKERKGSCLCGAVRVTANTQGDGMAACHCTICRKWGGGPLLAVRIADPLRLIGCPAVDTRVMALVAAGTLAITDVAKLGCVNTMSYGDFAGSR